MQRLLVSFSFPWVQQQCSAAWLLRSYSFLHRKNSFPLVVSLSRLVLLALWLLSRETRAFPSPFFIFAESSLIGLFSLLVVLSSSFFRVRVWLTCTRVFSHHLIVLTMGVAVTPQPPWSLQLPRCPELLMPPLSRPCKSSPRGRLVVANLACLVCLSIRPPSYQPALLWPPRHLWSVR